MIIHRNRCNGTPLFEDQAGSPVPVSHPCVQLGNGPVETALTLVANDAVGQRTPPGSQT